MRPIKTCLLDTVSFLCHPEASRRISVARFFEAMPLRMTFWRNLRLHGVRLLTLLFCLSVFTQPVHAVSKPRFVTTTSVLADIVKEIAGESLEVHYVASPKRDLHRVVPTPKDVLKVKKADVFIHHGLSAEPWLQPLLNAAGNKKFLGHSNAILDASVGIKALEVPGEVSRLHGDLHPGGNPHYWLDPKNVVIVAENMSRRLSELFPQHADKYRANKDAFKKQIETKLLEWERALVPFKGESLVTYHRSWSYFAERFDFEVVGEVEPKPGIPVTAKHLGKLIKIINDHKVRVVIKAPYFDGRATKKLADKTGVQVVELVQAPHAKKEVENYQEMMDYNVRLLQKALSK